MAIQHKVELDDDVYQHLKSRVQDFGETISTVLRRELGIDGAAGNAGKSDGHDSASDDSPPRPNLLGLVSAPSFITLSATEKYLRILGFLYSSDAHKFGELRSLKKRRRRYIARSSVEIESSGKSTHPRQIPESPFWALTNASTAHKREILHEVLRHFGFPTHDIDVIVRSVY